MMKKNLKNGILYRAGSRLLPLLAVIQVGMAKSTGMQAYWIIFMIAALILDVWRETEREKSWACDSKPPESVP